VSDEERAPRRFNLVQYWFEELKAKVPAKQPRASPWSLQGQPW
jgi:hypothetical protein